METMKDSERKNYTNNANEKIEGRQLLQAAINTIKKLQYMGQF